MARVFVAFALSDDARAEVARAGEALALTGVRLVPPEDLHVTLAFLGNRSDVTPVLRTLAEAAALCAPVEVRLGALGGFPDSARARTVWVGLSETGALLRTASILREALMRAPVSWSPDGGFVPHITIGRARGAGARVPPLAVAPVAFGIASLQVLESVLQGGLPPAYEVLGEVALRGAVSDSAHSA